MHREHKKGWIVLCVVAVGALLWLSSSKASDELPIDPLVGTWNVKTLPGSANPLLATMTFNLGGTTVEYDTNGTNSYVSPGEGLVLGSWKKTGHLSYQFKEQNFNYDSSGNLVVENLTTCNLTLGPDLNSYSATCELFFYSCSLTECPGMLLGGGPFPLSVTGTRFE